MTDLFYSDGFGEVPGHVDVGAASNGHVVRKELERNDIEDTL